MTARRSAFRSDRDAPPGMTAEPFASRSDRGAATVLVCALIAVVVAGAGVLAGIARAVEVRHLTAAVADAAALAAAAHASQGSAPACAAAGAVARRDNAVIVMCTLDGPTADVSVRLERAPWLFGSAPTLNSRAGPVETNDGGINP